MGERRWSRRQLLGGIPATVAGLGGCLVRQGGSRTDTPTDVTPEHLFQHISPRGDELVVELAQDHEVERLTLVAPDGSAFKSTSVEAGVTRTAFTILSIEPGGSGYEHYSPGTHELVAETDRATISTTVPLEPDLRITDVSQYRDGEKPVDLGKIAVTVENSGTGPTWVHQITFREAPNFASNTELTTDPGVIFLENSTFKESLIVNPGSRSKFVGSSPPLLFPENKNLNCNGISSYFDVLVGIGDKTNLSVQIEAESHGKARAAGPSGYETCSKFTVVTTEGSS